SSNRHTPRTITCWSAARQSATAPPLSLRLIGCPAICAGPGCSRRYLFLPLITILKSYLRHLSSRDRCHPNRYLLGLYSYCYSSLLGNRIAILIEPAGSHSLTFRPLYSALVDPYPTEVLWVL